MQCQPESGDKKKRMFMKAMVTFTNNLLDDKDKTPHLAVMQLQALCDKLKIGRKITLCNHCCELIGDKKCEGCAKNHVDTYYCSRECQEAAWPSHKLVCRKNQEKAKKARENDE